MWNVHVPQTKHALSTWREVIPTPNQPVNIFYFVSSFYWTSCWQRCAGWSLRCVLSSCPSWCGCATCSRLLLLVSTGPTLVGATLFAILPMPSEALTSWSPGIKTTLLLGTNEPFIRSFIHIFIFQPST